MIIRLATEKDIKELQPLYFELEKDAVSFQPEHFVIGNRDEEFFNAIFNSNHQDIIVAEESKKIIGFAHVMIIEQKRFRV